MIIINKKKVRYKLYARYLLSKKTTNFFQFRNKKKIVVALAADYGNLGDVAITFAQTKFLKDNFPDYEIIDFPISKIISDLKSLKSICDPADIITIVGGGNTGDMYDDIEFLRQLIIKSFPKNKIISFPQTIDFSDTIEGHKALAIAKTVYSKHRDLTLVAREEKSLRVYKEEFVNNKVLFTPDIVLSLNQQSKQIREGISFCMRLDAEKSFSKEMEDEMVSIVQSQESDVKFYDTHISKSHMSINERILELNKIWNHFSSRKLVITDRLHGMIFCAITGTPCIAIDNSNKKVSGVFKSWMKDYNYIHVLESLEINEFERILKEMIEIDTNQIIVPDITTEYLSILNEFKN